MSRVVFVGNVPYDMTEEQLIDIFSAVGPVAGFRLVFDRETGKAKGFGFCEYYDHETAMSAVRNLNGTDVKGRPLRIDLADSDPFLEGKTTNRGELDEGSGPNKTRDSGAIPPGVPVPPGSTALDVISNVIATMQPQQLMDIMGHMKNFVHNSPEQARHLLQTQPQLSYALFQAMLMNQIVDPSVLQRMLAATASRAPRSGPPPSAAPPIPPAPPTLNQPPYPGYAMPPPAAQFGHPPAVPPQYPAAFPPPPHQPVVAAPAPAPAAGGGITDDQRKAMLMQVLSLTPQQIEALPPNERATIQQLRAQLGVV